MHTIFIYVWGRLIHELLAECELLYFFHFLELMSIEKKKYECSALPKGWQREEVTRKSGLSAGKVDVYYYRYILLWYFNYWTLFVMHVKTKLWPTKLNLSYINHLIEIMPWAFLWQIQGPVLVYLIKKTVYDNYKILPWVNLFQKNTVHVLPPYYCKISSNIFLSILSYSSCLFPMQCCKISALGILKL